MGVRIGSVSSAAQTNPPPASNVETVICTLPGLSLAVDNAQVLLFSSVSILAGVGVTSITLTIRRGPLVTSPAVTPGMVHTLAAGASALLSFAAFDAVAGVFAGLQYCLTLIQTGATGASTLALQTLLAIVL